MPVLHQTLLNTASKLLSRRVIHPSQIQNLVKSSRTFSWTSPYDSDNEDIQLGVFGPQSQWFPLPGRVGVVAPDVPPPCGPPLTAASQDAPSRRDRHRQVVLSGVEETILRMGRSRRARPPALPEDLVHIIRNESCKVFLAIDPVNREARIYAVHLEVDVNDLTEAVLPCLSDADDSLLPKGQNIHDIKTDLLQRKTLSSGEIKQISDLIYKRIAKELFSSTDQEDDEDGSWVDVEDGCDDSDE